MHLLRFSLFVAASIVLGACKPLTEAVRSEPQHFIFFNRDRDRIAERAFLQTVSVAGAQLKYTWRELEPERDRYDFAGVGHDLNFLEGHGKRLFVQLQDVSFDDAVINVPDYLLRDPAFGGGVARQYAYEDDESTAVPAGWVSRRWDNAVQERFALLLNALGGEFDGRIEGISLPETAIEFGESGRLHPDGFTYDRYAVAVTTTMDAARGAFRGSHVIQYANFMPGEWLPQNDRGYLRAVYAHANAKGVGIGGPDLLPHRRGQQNHSYPLIAVRAQDVVAGVAVQWGNLEDIDPETRLPVTVEELHRYARDVLGLDYIFWGTQEPYYTQAALPYLDSLGR